jgi:hypothetical protein
MLGSGGPTGISLHSLDNVGRTKSLDLKVYADSLYIYPNTTDQFNFIVDGLPNKSLGGTDSVLVQDANDKIWKVASSDIGGGSGTINSGTTGKPAYYVGATTLDDFAPIDYATSGNLQTITHQNTTDVGTLYQGIAVQTGNFITAKNSGATTVFELTKDGYGFFPAGTGANSSVKVGTNGLFDVSGVGLGIYSASLYRTYIGQFGLAYRDADVATIDFGNIGLFSTTNRIRISTPAEGTVKFHSTGLTAANIIKGTGGEGTSSSLYLEADEADDAADTWKITSETGNDLTFTNNATENLRIISTGGLTMPEIVAPSTPASGYVTIYPKSDGLWYGKDDAGVETKLSNPSLNKGVFIASPTSADIVDVWQTPVAITITSLKAILRGTTPSVTYNIRFGTDITSATTVFTSDITCTSITTGCSNSSGFNDATIPAGSFIWVYTTAASGTIGSISLTINYTED